MSDGETREMIASKPELLRSHPGPETCHCGQPGLVTEMYRDYFIWGSVYGPHEQVELVADVVVHTCERCGMYTGEQASEAYDRAAQAHIDTLERT